MNTIELFEAHNLPLELEVPNLKNYLRFDIANALGLCALDVVVITDSFELCGETQTMVSVDVYLADGQVAKYDYFERTNKIVWMH